MNGKEIVYKALRHEDLPRPVWLPLVGVHAGKLKGYNATEIYQNEDKLYECLLEAVKLYQPDGQIIIFDLQLEAEILGCELMWDDYGPPCVTSHPLETTEVIPTKGITKNDGRFPMVMNITRKLKKEIGDYTALYGLFCGPFTLASHLRGTQLFRDMRTNPEYVEKLMVYTTELALQIADMYIEEGADVIVPVDPVVSQISPANFERFCAPGYKKIFDHIRAKNSHSSFFVCGNATHLIDGMCKTGPDSLNIDENVNMVEAKKVTDNYDIMIGGNIPLTSIMLFGNQLDNMKYTVDLIDSFDSFKNLNIAPGCDMPYHIPPENTIALAHACLHLDEAREMVANYSLSKIDIDVELPDYNNLKKPLLEAFTLNSSTCAACQYLWGATCDIMKHFGDKIDAVEIRYDTPENIAHIQKMGVKQLPSLYLNGELKYSSIIPETEKMIKEIEELLKK